VEKLASQAGISLRRIRARQLTSAMVHKNDYVLVMEHRHIDDLSEMIPGKVLPETVELFGHYLPHSATGDTQIPDPYFGDWHAFMSVFDLINLALPGLVESIEQRLGRQ